jgi:hypothetical protein
VTSDHEFIQQAVAAATDGQEEPFINYLLNEDPKEEVK